MKTDSIKPTTQRPWCTFTATICISLVLLTSHETVWAFVLAPTSGMRAQAIVHAPAVRAVTDYPLLTAQAIGTNAYELPLLLGKQKIRAGYVSGVTLEGDRTLRIRIHDRTHITEASRAIHNIDPRVSMSVENEDIVLVFPETIASSVESALQGQTLDMSRVGGSDGTQDMNVFECIVVLAGVYAVAHYAMKWLCKIAGLTPPTNSPPPPRTNPPPTPPRTNAPPGWTNHGPVTLTGGTAGTQSFTADPGMPLEIQTAFGTSATNPLFRVEGGDGKYNGVASFSAMGMNELYDSTAYVDTNGAPYISCLRSTIQSTHSLTGTGTNGWRNELTLYIWANDTMVCFSAYDPEGVLRENSIILRPLPNVVRLQSLDHVFVDSWDPTNSMFFRSSSELK